MLLTTLSRKKYIYCVIKKKLSIKSKFNHAKLMFKKFANVKLKTEVSKLTAALANPCSVVA